MSTLPATVTILSDIDRQNLLKEKETRTKELQAKRLELDRLRSKLHQAAQRPVAPRGQDAKTILESALQVAEESAKEAAEKYASSVGASPVGSPDSHHPKETADDLRPDPGDNVEISVQDQIIRYEKGCQTEFLGGGADELRREQSRLSQDAPSYAQGQRLSDATSLLPLAKEPNDEDLDQQLGMEPPHRQSVQPREVSAESPLMTESAISPAIEMKEIPLEEQIRIQQSAGFNSFAKKSVFVLEKILNTDRIVDILGEFSDEQVPRQAQEGLRKIVSFADHRLSSNRAVTDIQPCTHSTFVASYGKRKDAFSSEVNGCCLVWTLENSSRPLHTLTSHAPVTCAIQGGDSCNLFFGGTSIGSLVMWDVRAQQTPVQTTRMTFETHQTQVHTIVKQGSNNSTATILSVDEESRACFWSVAMNLTLASSVDFRQFGSASDASPTAANKKGMMFTAAVKGTTLFGGCEDGSILEASLSSASGKVDSKIHEWQAGNDRASSLGSPVLGLDPKPVVKNGPAIGPDLILTSSTNWTLTIWNKIFSGTYAPIHMLEPEDDYTFDAKWSPSNPTVFGCVGGSGLVHLYNLNKSWHTPILSHNFTPGLALSKLAWFMEGKALLCGSSEGVIYSAVVPSEVHSYKSGTSLNYFEDNLNSMNRPVVKESV